MLQLGVLVCFVELVYQHTTGFESSVGLVEGGAMFHGGVDTLEWGGVVCVCMHV